MTEYQGGGSARDDDPDTSHEAAQVVDANKLRANFIRALKEHGPRLSYTEIAKFNNADRSWYSPRGVELLARGIIREAGSRLCENAAGNWRNMKAWELRDANAAAANIEAELLAVQTGPKPKPVKRPLAAMNRAWNQASPEERAAFRKQHGLTEVDNPTTRRTIPRDDPRQNGMFE
jgi:DNA-binding Lrp family transcriptional regulator